MSWRLCRFISLHSSVSLLISVFFMSCLAVDCPICYAPLTSQQRHLGEVVATNCPQSVPHEFHRTCINRWFRQLDNEEQPHTCPICREENVIIRELPVNQEAMVNQESMVNRYLQKPITMVKQLTASLQESDTTKFILCYGILSYLTHISYFKSLVCAGLLGAFSQSQTPSTFWKPALALSIGYGLGNFGTKLTHYVANSLNISPEIHDAIPMVTTCAIALGKLIYNS